jgi:hypothetical protein
MSIEGRWCAIVSEPRCRLVYLGEADGTFNFLWQGLSPSRHVPRGAEDARPWGGHLFWLGPQREWPVDWPPSTATDYTAAAWVRAGAGLLALEHPADPAHPGAVQRSYAWEEGALRATASWPAGAPSCQGIHVLQIIPPRDVSSPYRPTDAFPEGHARWAMDGRHQRPQGRIQDPDWDLDEGLLRKRGHPGPQKWGFPPLPLTARFAGGWSLEMSPAAAEGQAGDDPDHGLGTQVWIGGPENPWWELEQATTRLHGAPGTRVQSSVRLTPAR